MSTACARSTTLTYTGDITATQTVPAAQNLASPGVIELKNLNSGANTITVPTGGATAVAVTIIPPAGNTHSILLKALTGDTGVRLHNTDPTTLALDSSVTTFVLTVGASITGLRFIWS